MHLLQKIKKSEPQKPESLGTLISPDKVFFPPLKNVPLLHLVTHTH